MKPQLDLKSYEDEVYIVRSDNTGLLMIAEVVYIHSNCLQSILHSHFLLPY